MSGIIGTISSRNKIIRPTATVDQGGTGVSTLTDGGVLLGSGAGAVTATAVLANSEMLVGDGTTDPVLESGATLRTSIGVGTGDTPQFTGLNLGGTAITSTATELNLLDGSSVTNATVSKAVVLDSSGNIALPIGKGIDFAATADIAGMVSELLDDYEEGEFTVAPNSASGGHVTFSASIGRYIKIGKHVSIWGYFAVSAVDDDSTAFTLELPFAVATNPTGTGGNNSAVGSTIWQQTDLPGDQGAFPIAVAGGAKVIYIAVVDDGAWQDVLCANFSTSSAGYFSVSYQSST